MAQKHDRSWDLRIDYLSNEERKFLSTTAFDDDESLSDWQSKLEVVTKELKAQRIWNAYLGETYFGKKSHRYRVEHLDLMSRAQGSVLSSPGNRVTDYCRWLYSLYLPSAKQSSLEAGKHGERAIERAIRKCASRSQKTGRRSRLAECFRWR